MFSQVGVSPSPLPDPDDRGLPTRWNILRAWLEYVVGTTSQPRGGSLLVDLQATGISVGATVILLLDRPTSEVVRDINGVRYNQGVTLTQSELTQPMAVSLFGDGVQAGSALRLTATGQTSPLYFADNTNVVMLRCIPIGHSLNSTTTTTYPHPTEVEACVDAATAGLLAYLEFVIEQRRNLVPGYTDAMVEQVQAQYAAARVAAEPTCSQPTVTVTYGEGYSIVPGGGIMSQDSWELATYGNVLPSNHVPFSDLLSRRVAYANYVRSARAARDTTELSPRLAISLGTVSRLVQPESGRFGSGSNSVEILTASPAEGVIVATARPQGAPDSPFGWGDPSPPSLIWPEPLWKPLFSRLPLSGLGGSAYRAAIYRDGESVATVDRTPPATPSNWTGPFAEHTNEDGSYFLSFDSNAGLLQGFLSFVIDRTPPMGCFEQVNDFFEGDPTNASGVADLGQVGKVRRFTTEATRTSLSQGETWESVSDTRSEFSKSLEPGTYTLEYPGQYFDHVGNPMPTPLPTAQFQVHAVPAQQRYGAQATLTLPGNDDTPVYDAPVPSIAVTFNQQVAGLRKSMFAITGRKDDGTTVDLSFTLSGDDGEITGNATGGGTTFNLSLDTDEQDYNTSWLAVFSPQAGGSLVAVAGEQTPEPCVLRSRCSWLVGQDPAFGRTPIDTGSSAVVLNRVPTLTATIQEDSLPDAPERYDSLIDLSADTILPVNYITESEQPYQGNSPTATYLHGQSSPFVPQVPPALDEATDVPYSYFGLSTTVYPSAPKALPCPAPGASQPQSSLIVGNSNVTSLNVQIAGAYQVTQPLTFSAALNSEQCSQNVWAHSSTGGGPSGSEHSTTSRTQSLSTQANTVFVYTPRDGSGGIVFGRSSGGTAFSPPAISQGDVRAQASASGSSWVFGSATATALASRTAATYPAFQTSTLGQLSLKMNLSVTVKTTTYSGLVGATPITWRATRARESWEIQELNSNYPQSGNVSPSLNSPIRPLWDAYVALPVNSAERLAAFNQYNAAREAGREDFYHVDNMDRQWPPEPEEWGGYQWGEDPPTNVEVPSGSPNSIGIEGPFPVGSGDQFFGYYLATYYVTDKNGNWVPITSYGGNPAGSFGAAITVEGPKAAGAGVYYEDAGYSVSNGLGHTPYEDANGDIQAGFFTASPNKASPMQPFGRSLSLSSTLTLTRLQEEHLAAGQPVQVQVGSLVYTITAS